MFAKIKLNSNKRQHNENIQQCQIHAIWHQIKSYELYLEIAKYDPLPTRKIREGLKMTEIMKLANKDLKQLFIYISSI